MVNKLKNSYRNNTLENTIDLYWTEVASKRLNFNAKEQKIKLVQDITENFKIQLGYFKNFE